MRCIANTLSNRTSTTTGPTSFSAWTGCWTILRRSFPRRVARWPADDGCFHSDAGPWHEGIPLEALGAARQVFPVDLRRDVDLLLHGRGGGDSCGHATRRAVDTSGSLFSFTGRALRPRARERSARAHLGLLAPAAVLHSRGRHLRTVVLRVRVAGDRAVRRHGVALCTHQREPAARHAAALGSEQREGHRPIGPVGCQQNVWPERFAGGLAHGHAAVDLRRVFPHNHETSSIDVTHNRLAEMSNGTVGPVPTIPFDASA